MMDIFKLSKKMAEQDSDLDKLLKQAEESRKMMETKAVVVSTAVSCDTTDPWGDRDAKLERTPK